MISQIKINISTKFLNRNRIYVVIQSFMPRNSSIYSRVYCNYAYMIHNYRVFFFCRYRQKEGEVLDGKHLCNCPITNDGSLQSPHRSYENCSLFSRR